MSRRSLTAADYLDPDTFIPYSNAMMIWHRTSRKRVLASILILKRADAGPSSATPSNAPSSIPAAPVTAAEPPAQQIAMRCLIVTQDASIIIGRAGAHVNEIRVSLIEVLKCRCRLWR